MVPSSGNLIPIPYPQPLHSFPFFISPGKKDLEILTVDHTKEEYLQRMSCLETNGNGKNCHRLYVVTELFSPTVLLTAKMSGNRPIQLSDSCDFQRNFFLESWYFVTTFHYMHVCIKLCCSCQIKLSTVNWLSPIQHKNKTPWEILPFWPQSMIIPLGRGAGLGGGVVASWEIHG